MGDCGISVILLKERGISASWNVPKRGTSGNFEGSVAHMANWPILPEKSMNVAVNIRAEGVLMKVNVVFGSS